MNACNVTGIAPGSQVVADLTKDPFPFREFRFYWCQDFERTKLAVCASASVKTSWVGGFTFGPEH